MGVFGSYNDQMLWDRTPQQLRVLYQQAARERRRREASAIRATAYAQSKYPLREAHKLELA